MLLDPTKEEEDDNATEYSKADSAWLNETDDASQMSLDSTRNNEKKKSKKKDKSKDKIKKNEENGSTIPRNPNKNILHNKIINKNNDKINNIENNHNNNSNLSNDDTIIQNVRTLDNVIPPGRKEISDSNHVSGQDSGRDSGRGSRRGSDIEGESETDFNHMLDRPNYTRRNGKHVDIIRDKMLSVTARKSRSLDSADTCPTSTSDDDATSKIIIVPLRTESD